MGGISIGTLVGAFHVHVMEFHLLLGSSFEKLGNTDLLPPCRTIRLLPQMIPGMGCLRNNTAGLNHFEASLATTRFLWHRASSTAQLILAVHERPNVLYEER